MDNVFKEQMKEVTDEQVYSYRAVISDQEILLEGCVHCSAKPGKLCKSTQGYPLQVKLDQMEFSFHRGRIMSALHTQVTTKLKGVLSPVDRSLIVYYAFIMLCDACAANSEKLFSRKYTAVELQAFFCGNAITELKKDKLIGV